MTPADLLKQALEAPADSAERILFAVAAIDALTAAPLVLVGGGAQLTHTGIGRITDVDVVGPVTSRDEERIRSAGLEKRGRHWVFESPKGAVAIEVPGDTLLGEEPPEVIDLGGLLVRIISVNDLMMDRLLQATDGTAVTWNEAFALAVAARDRINWTSIRARCAAMVGTEPFLQVMPDLLGRLEQALD
ncbi:MAG: hypothetical protein P1T08_11045 [Acidimicrobiia bacterium]|nr:hypothetical protein [Acidimicrobiia bacterium]